ncbi:NepR family anti-sigma factor [Roseinatronobacter sp. NSM]|uniref:NepR family anti-sigma factor n=1 Tax=Roseinatronobacter sp. NSM TaxID=3457785 RepID=UPI004036BA9D
MSGNRNRSKKDIAPAVSRQIDENLKRLYTDTTSEELPKSLTDLLEALRQQDAQKKAGDQ